MALDDVLDNLTDPYLAGYISGLQEENRRLRTRLEERMAVPDLTKRVHPFVWLALTVLGLAVVIANRHGIWFVLGLVDLAFGMFSFAVGGERRWGDGAIRRWQESQGGDLTDVD